MKRKNNLKIHRENLENLLQERPLHLALRHHHYYQHDQPEEKDKRPKVEEIEVQDLTTANEESNKDSSKKVLDDLQLLNYLVLQKQLLQKFQEQQHQDPEQYQQALFLEVWKRLFQQQLLVAHFKQQQAHSNRYSPYQVPDKTTNRE